MLCKCEQIVEVIRESPNLVNVDAFELRDKMFDAQGADVQFEGDLISGIVIEHAHAVLVCGAFVGSATEQSEIRADGDVIVLGDVSQAQISGKKIWIEGGVSHTHLYAQEGIEIVGDLENAACEIGGYEKEKHPLEVMQDHYTLAEREWFELKNQLALEEKILDKKFKALRLSVHFSIGKIIQHNHNRVEIDLEPIYEASNGQPEKVVDQMILNFYAKAIVGKMVQANRTYLSGGKHRMNNFRNVITDLKELILMVRNLDKHAQLLKDLEVNLNEGIQNLQEESPTLCVGGKLMPDVQLRFVVYNIAGGSAGKTISLSKRIASLNFLVGQSGEVGVNKIDLSGKHHPIDTISDIGQTVFFVKENDIAWEQV